MTHPFLASLLLVTLVLLLLAAGIEDLRRREIAQLTNALIAALAPVWWWALGLPLWPAVALQIGIAAVVFALFVGAFALGWMGGGDVKLIGALALWLPLAPLADMLTVMAVAGGVLTLVFVIDHRVRRRAEAPEVPYGVAIALGGYAAIAEPILNQFR